MCILLHIVLFANRGMLYILLISAAFPRVVDITYSMRSVEGQLLWLECTVSGIPTPSIQWFKNDQSISSHYNSLTISTAINGMLSIVKINSASLSDSGIYRCIATNDAGSSNDTIEIQVTKGKF